MLPLQRMQQKIIRMPELTEKQRNPPHATLSFQPFLQYIREHLKDKDNIKKDIYALILQKFESYPNIHNVADLEESGQFRELLDMLYITLTSLVDDEKHLLWGLSLPISPLIFYGSDALYDLLLDKETQELRSQFFEESNQMEDQKKRMVYTFLLQRFYHYQFGTGTDMTCSVNDPSSRLIKHYRINVDTRFVEVSYSGILPDLNLETLHVHLQEQASINNIELIERLLPLNQFIFSGFSVITITDITEQQALLQIRNMLVNNHGKIDESCNTNIISSLQAIGGSADLSFSLTPIFRVNQRIIYDMDANNTSVLFSLGKQKIIRNNFYQPLLEKFTTNPRMIYFRNLDTTEQTNTDITKLLQLAGIKSYALIPIYYNNQLAGTLEIHSSSRDILNEHTFARLDPAIPMIAQLMQNTSEEFANQINEIIREKFTPLQPAVQWKFNEAALGYLNNKVLNNNKPNYIKKIDFPQVYPLYGAIDIRNSTVERNNMVLQDLQCQFGLLQEVLVNLKQISGFGLTDELIFKCSRWKRHLQQGLTTHDEIKINQFFTEEAHPFLLHFQQSHPATNDIISQYLNDINPASGKAWRYRRRLEESMQNINVAINNYLDLMNVEIQQAYPCYFEKFRTDGIEYDIYIGQSIAPDRPFDNIYIKNIRRWQLASMAAIAKLSHNLKPELQVPMDTTQLIFAYSNPIDISFRHDERRFDVEGGYNIRYHILKKRIDKATIKGSGERLTQPGKIAIIYFDQKDADEYISYMQHLEEKGLLLSDIDFLELDELQGVSGLKALRVSVQLEGNTSD